MIMTTLLITYYYLNTIGLSYAHVFHSCPTNCTCGKTWLIDEYYKKIVLALTTADALSIPRRIVGFYKYWWYHELDELKTKSIESHQLWVAAGRPRSGDLYNRKRIPAKPSIVGVFAITNGMHVVSFLMSCTIVSCKMPTLGSGSAGIASLNAKKAVHRSWWTYQ